MCPEFGDEEERAYHPHTKEVNGLHCFKDHARACGADCMAFQTEKPEGADYRGQWANCAILVNEHKSAKHLIIIAQGVSTLLKREQDRARTTQTPPNVVLPSRSPV